MPRSGEGCVCVVCWGVRWEGGGREKPVKDEGKMRRKRKEKIKVNRRRRRGNREEGEREGDEGKREEKYR